MKKIAVLGFVFLFTVVSGALIPAKAEIDKTRCDQLHEACREWVMDQDFGFIKTILYLSECDNLYYLCIFSQIFPYPPFSWFWFF